ncbi:MULTISPECIES: hypothetical protein [unclassified Pseudoalteromonas]|uniref:hypothetical protein n=1 Tax=unclassified Pseudoalteromonas TaxID=194690 RepID=UPI001F42597B|nr:MULTISPECIES: hypothetical protein [unclassified Pseudoalteromonas]MCF2827064.1 hypothetical protein [Pseudoalteromonas sp. OF5H-5]MCF2832026.1 hypothetical protein [Pseudoalteromonas sp. DL2-H6]MCF2925923.1 hypothetical protein [Pseudoalteromonas sp. DL2-H1]
MATPKQPLRQTYEVTNPFQCPNTKCWHDKGATVYLLPSEAEFLILGGKVKLPTKKTTKGAD